MKQIVHYQRDHLLLLLPPELPLLHPMQQKREKEERKKREEIEAKLNADIARLQKQNEEKELRIKEKAEAHIRNKENRGSKQEFFRKQRERKDANDCLRRAFEEFHKRTLNKMMLKGTELKQLRKLEYNKEEMSKIVVDPLKIKEDKTARQ